MRAGDRLFIPITYGFSVRYLVPTGVLDRLRSVCRPVVGLGWEDPRLQQELAELGVEVVALPPAQLSDEYRAHRRRMAILHERRLSTPTSRIRRHRDERSFPPVGRAISRARRALDASVLSIPGRASALERRDETAVVSGTNVHDFDALLSATNVDAVMSLTPYHDQDGLILWSAARGGSRTTSAWISFDNPTTRRRAFEQGDSAIVWNRHMSEQLGRAYPELALDSIQIVGAPQFDLHRRADLVMDRSTWLDAVGAPSDRPIVLYGASPAHLVPGEPDLVRALDESISLRRVGGDPFLVVRRHPVDPPENWRGTALRNGTVTEPWRPTNDPMRSWPDDEELRFQMSTLAHSDVHVNICSSMTLDGAMFDRPQIGPGFVPGVSTAVQRQIRAMYRQEHWSPIERSGAVERPDGLDGLERCLTDAIENPGGRRLERQAMLEEVLTFTDGRASERLVDSL